MFPACLPKFYDRTIINKLNLIISSHETNKNKLERITLVLGDISGFFFPNVCNTVQRVGGRRPIPVLIENGSFVGQTK